MGAGGAVGQAGVRMPLVGESGSWRGRDKSNAQQWVGLGVGASAECFVAQRSSRCGHEGARKRPNASRVFCPATQVSVLQRHPRRQTAAPHLVLQVQECLEDNMDESAFSVACKQELEEVIAKRVADFRLDTPLRDACEDDLKDSCGTSLSDMDGDERLKASGLNCLQQYREELKSDACRREVLRRTQRAARDIRFDEVLADACTDDRIKLCNDVQAVGAGRGVSWVGLVASGSGGLEGACMEGHNRQWVQDGNWAVVTGVG